MTLIRKLIFKLFGVHHNCMVQVRDYYLYIDMYGNMWSIKPTGQYEIPLSISLERRP